MRSSHAIVLVFLISGCSAAADASASASVSVSASVTAQQSPSPSAMPTEPDWSALPRLEENVTATVNLTGGWSVLLGAAPVAHGSLWISNGSEGEPPALRRLDPETLEITAKIDLGGEQDVFPPDAYGAAFSANGVWVPLMSQKAVVLVDHATNSVSRRIQVDGTPYGLLEDGHDLWITDFGSSEVLRIDIPTGDERLRIRIPAPTWMVSGPEGLWVIEHNTGFVTRLDPVTGEELARVHVGGRPGIILGLGSIWASSSDEKTMSRIDPVTHAVVATIGLPSHPSGSAIAGGSVWVTVGPQRGACERTSYLVRINPASNEVDGILNVPCAGSPVSDGARLWVNSLEGEAVSIVRVDAGARP